MQEELRLQKKDGSELDIAINHIYAHYIRTHTLTLQYPREIDEEKVRERREIERRRNGRKRANTVYIREHAFHVRYFILAKLFYSILCWYACAYSMHRLVRQQGHRYSWRLRTEPSIPSTICERAIVLNHTEHL